MSELLAAKVFIGLLIGLCFLLVVINDDTWFQDYFFGGLFGVLLSAAEAQGDPPSTAAPNYLDRRQSQTKSFYSKAFALFLWDRNSF